MTIMFPTPNSCFQSDNIHKKNAKNRITKRYKNIECYSKACLIVLCSQQQVQKNNRDRKNSGKGTITFQAANLIHGTNETAQNTASKSEKRKAVEKNKFYSTVSTAIIE
jgi:hypothetical protein